jgi:hypothetical protein
MTYIDLIAFLLITLFVVNTISIKSYAGCQIRSVFKANSKVANRKIILNIQEGEQ